MCHGGGAALRGNVSDKTGPAYAAPRPGSEPRQRLCDTAAAEGLRYKVLRPGKGAMPVASDRVQVHYIGYLSKDGEVFDQGRDVTFAVTRVIPGFADGLKLITPGSIYRLCIPHTLGYGEEGSGPIPPSADLVFQVELVAVNPPK